VISELDIYRAANLLLDRHGADALIAAARMIDRMLELATPKGSPCGGASCARRVFASRAERACKLAASQFPSMRQ